MAKHMLNPNLAKHFRSRKNNWAREYHRRFVAPRQHSVEYAENVRQFA
jgi:hypothetical protein